MKQTVEDDKLKDKLSAADKAKILHAVGETIKWLDANHTAEKDEFEAKQKEIETVCNPIMTAMYQATGGAPPSTASASSAAGGASTHHAGGVEEVD
jgi:L1 cell adhesion molecule like protein